MSSKIAHFIGKTMLLEDQWRNWY